MSAQGEAFVRTLMTNGRRGPTNGAVAPITTGPQEPLEILADELPPEPRPVVNLSGTRKMIISYGPTPGTYVLVIEDRDEVIISRTVDHAALTQVVDLLNALVPVRDWTGGALGPAKPGQESAPTGAGTRRRTRQGRPAPGAGGREPAGAGPEAV